MRLKGAQRGSVKLLLDTCTFLWLISDQTSLSSRARTLLTDPTNPAYLSSVSA
jgi:PIN domain nuclease of toxin-antitoxin system